MPKLRHAVVHRIRDQLTSHPAFVFEDFLLAYDKDGNLVEITFAAEPSYKFAISEQRALIESLSGLGSRDKAPGQVSVISAPGQYKKRERTHEDSVDDAILKIREWLILLDEDLRLPPPEVETANEFLEQLDEAIRSNPEVLKGRFSESEAAEMRERLDKVEKQLSELFANRSDAGDETNRIESDIKAAKDNLPCRSKGVWYRMTAARLQALAKYLEKSHVARTIVTEAIKSLFP